MEDDIKTLSEVTLKLLKSKKTFDWTMNDLKEVLRHPETLKGMPIKSSKKILEVLI